MTRYFAFLRAINVGGHSVKMETLRQVFTGFGFRGVETFIASGNVIFETEVENGVALEKQIEVGLEETFGFPPVVFLRTFPELSNIAARQPFPADQFARATAFNVAFLKDTPPATAIERLMSLQNEIDSFAVVGREMYWLCKLRQSESKFANTVLEKVLGQPSTMRQISTMQRLIDKYRTS